MLVNIYFIDFPYDLLLILSIEHIKNCHLLLYLINSDFMGKFKDKTLIRMKGKASVFKQILNSIYNIEMELDDENIMQVMELIHHYEVNI